MVYETAESGMSWCPSSIQPDKSGLSRKLIAPNHATLAGAFTEKEVDALRTDLEDMCCGKNAAFLRDFEKLRETGKTPDFSKVHTLGWEMHLANAHLFSHGFC
jgi:hypothetical protein